MQPQHQHVEGTGETRGGRCGTGCKTRQRPRVCTRTTRRRDGCRRRDGSGMMQSLRRPLTRTPFRCHLPRLRAHTSRSGRHRRGGFGICRYIADAQAVWCSPLPANTRDCSDIPEEEESRLPTLIVIKIFQIGLDSHSHAHTLTHSPTHPFSHARALSIHTFHVHSIFYPSTLRMLSVPTLNVKTVYIHFRVLYLHYP
jgi:hypothetical protein